MWARVACLWGSFRRSTTRRYLPKESGFVAWYTPRPRTAANWSVAQYNKEAEELLQELGDRVHEGFQDSSEIDVEFSQGVLNLKFPNGVFVLNTQTPNRQIWLSSPVSGPARYYFDEESSKWRNTRDDHVLQERLRLDLQAFTGRELDLDSRR